MMRTVILSALSLCFAFVLQTCPVYAAGLNKISLAKDGNNYEILIDDSTYAVYLPDYKGTPIVWPIVGPAGQHMTRDYPMREYSLRLGNHEMKDHPHHRSLWFSHGEVNDSNFWHLGKQKIVHRRYVQSNCDGKEAVLVTENDWLDKNAKQLCSDTRTLRFGVLDSSRRYIDFDITVTAEQDKVVFHDTKEGTLGIRVSGTMDIDAKKRNPQWGGHMRNAEGKQDNDVWGKQSDWVDYYGPVDGKTAGITIMNHPSSFRAPTYWHVRSYGLFAANPFGVHDFDKTQPKADYAMKKGDSFTLRYRLLFHDGIPVEKIAGTFDRYAEKNFNVPISSKAEPSKQLLEQIVRLKAKNLPLIDYHIHLRGGMTAEKAYDWEQKTAIRSGVLENHGRDWPLSDNGKLATFIREARRFPLLVGIQVNDRDWFNTVDKDLRDQLDFILADTMIMNDSDGTPRKLWLEDQYEIDDPEAWLDRYFKHCMTVVNEPITILANPTWLPPRMEKYYDLIWTHERIEQLIDAAVKNKVALEIQSGSSYPRAEFVELARKKGAKLTIGRNNHSDKVDELKRSLDMLEKLNVKADEMLDLPMVGQ